MSLLIHIGYFKTGSSWLQQVVFNQPKLGYATVLEQRAAREAIAYHDPTDFDPAAVRELSQPGVDEALGAGLVPVITEERLSGASYNGLDSFQIAHHLNIAWPDARILIVVREQKSLILSCYLQYLRTSGAWSIEEFLGHEAGMGQWRAPIFRRKHFEFHRLANHYNQLFGADQVLVIPYELLRSDGAAYIARLAAFSGASSSATESDIDAMVNRKVLAAAPPAELAAKRLATRLIQIVPDWARRTPLFSRHVIRGLFGVVRTITHQKMFSGMNHDRMKGVIEAEIGTYYHASNRALAEIVDWNPVAYGYDCG